MDNLIDAEQDLVVALRNNDEEALYLMTRLYKGISRSVANWLPADIAENVFQETLIKAWNKRHLYNPSLSRFRTWFFTIYRNNALDLLRLERKEKKKKETNGLMREGSCFQLYRRAIAELLRDDSKILSALKWKILLADIDSFPETVNARKLAEYLGSTESSIRTQRNKAYKKLVESGLPDLRLLRKGPVKVLETKGSTE